MSYWDNIFGQLDTPAGGEAGTDTANALLGAGAQTTGAAVDPQVPNPSMEPGGYLWNSADAISRMPADMQRLFAHAQEAPLETAGSVLSSLPASRLGAEGASLLSSGAALGAGAIRAFHASPFQFDRFRIGENLKRGEGSNFITPGGYFAGNENVARRYWEGFRGSPEIDVDATRAVLRQHGITDVDQGVVDYLRTIAASNPQTLEAEIRAGLRTAFDPQIRAMTADQRLALYRDIRATARPPSMYEVSLDMNPHQLLDWDAPLAGQPQTVRNFVETHLPQMGENAVLRDLPGGIPNIQLAPPIGRDFYRGLRPRGVPYSLAAGNAPHELMRNAGIPGVQYFDQGSRAAQQGSRNYVVFPGQDELVQILRRYGIAGPAITVGTGAALLGQDDQ